MSTNTWHTHTRNGRTVMIAPDGTRYAGTAKEISAAGLYPWCRRALANDLRLARYLRDKGLETPEQARESAASRRRDAIAQNDAGHQGEHARKNILRIEIEAAARAEGITAAEYERQAIEEALALTRSRCDGRLPYTRQEIRALTR